MQGWTPAANEAATDQSMEAAASTAVRIANDEARWAQSCQRRGTKEQAVADEGESEAVPRDEAHPGAGRGEDSPPWSSAFFSNFKRTPGCLGEGGELLPSWQECSAAAQVPEPYRPGCQPAGTATRHAAAGLCLPVEAEGADHVDPLETIIGRNLPAEATWRLLEQHATAMSKAMLDPPGLPDPADAPVELPRHGPQVHRREFQVEAARAATCTRAFSSPHPARLLLRVVYRKLSAACAR